jgi:hypothetical protein
MHKKMTRESDLERFKTVSLRFLDNYYIPKVNSAAEK